MIFLFQAFLISIFINLVLFVIAYVFKTDKLTDVSYAFSFIFIAGYCLLFNALTKTSILLFFLILFWGLRLGVYLFIRILKSKKDKRFDNIRTSFIKFFMFWLLQAITVWVILIPSILFFQFSTDNIPNLAFLGIFIWMLGLMIETFSDYQKYEFKRKPSNKDKWIAKGLWKYSRHPNYLGEITIWVGIYIYTISSLSIFYSLISLISPFWIFILLNFISGVPILEKSANEKWGNDPKYLNYKEKTKSLIPYIY